MEEMGKTGIQQITSEEEGIEEEKEGTHPTRGPLQLFSRGSAYAYDTLLFTRPPPIGHIETCHGPHRNAPRRRERALTQHTRLRAVSALGSIGLLMASVGGTTELVTLSVWISCPAEHL